MELLHVHLVLNLVTLAKNTSGTVESMLEMISLHEKKKKETKGQFIRVLLPVNALNDIQYGGCRVMILQMLIY